MAVTPCIFTDRNFDPAKNERRVVEWNGWGQLGEQKEVKWSEIQEEGVCWVKSRVDPGV